MKITHLLGLCGVACFVLPISPAMALITGICIALTLGNPVLVTTNRIANYALKIGIILLGAGMNLNVIWQVGADGFAYTAIGLCLTFAIGLWLGKRCQLSSNLSLLITSGTAICGGSAIAAISSVIRPKSQEITIALAVVFFLNAIALLLFPPLGAWFGFSPHQFGLWAALAIHDTSSVVGAGAAFGNEALQTAVIVKMARALWIIPVSIVAGFWFQQDKKESLLKRLMPPGFILGYLLMAALFTWCPIPDMKELVLWTNWIARHTMTLALFLIGAGFSREALRKTGWQPLSMAVMLWILVSCATALALYFNWIQ